MSKSPKASKSTKAFVRARDKVCLICKTRGSRKNKLSIHHIKPRWSHPHLIDDVNNCVLWCTKCHREYHGG
jgi:5-methylcytosine-specific restriction endonuclease McrA